MVWAGVTFQKHLRVRIDRAFFRSAYDAHRILEDLAERARTATNRHELAALVKHHINEALHPNRLILYLESKNGLLCTEGSSLPFDLQSLSPTIPELADLARQGQPREVRPVGQASSKKFSVLGVLEPECLVPILGREARLTGLIVLGQRLSEEPYSGEDKRLLASVVSQVSLALENMRLAEEMAERIAAEQQALREMEIARQVQNKLLPQKAPLLETLQYAGVCIQARAVGGDYYDYLDLGPGRVGLVLADISGKGISGALLMANLQANLRSRSALALDNLGRLLRTVNQILHESTEPNHYVTLFFGDYKDGTRRLRYANCGHSPPVLVRSDGGVQRLTATATVVGLFENWECSIAEVELAPRDTLLIFSDGVTEAMNDAEEEFGDVRLIGTLLANRHLPVSALLTAITTNVQRFSGREQEDDLTLIVARAQ